MSKKDPPLPEAYLRLGVMITPVILVMGILALFGEPDLLERLTNKSWLFRLPNGSSYYRLRLPFIMVPCRNSDGHTVLESFFDRVFSCLEEHT